MYCTVNCLILCALLCDRSYAATCEFLQNNNLLSLIRAHEAQDAGCVCTTLLSVVCTRLADAESLAEAIWGPQFGCLRLVSLSHTTRHEQSNISHVGL